MGAIPIALWRGENGRAGTLLERLQTQAARHSQAYWQSWSRSYQQVVDARARGLAPRLQLDNISTGGLSGPPELDMLGTLAEEAVSALGVERVNERRVGWCAPEILRAVAQNGLRDALQLGHNYWSRIGPGLPFSLDTETPVQLIDH